MYDISIAIPTYNRAKFLKRTLNNILEELSKITNKKVTIEILVSDNCSTDKTEFICKEFNEKYHFFSYYKNNQNIGFKKNFLGLLDLSKGKYIWFMGDDDGIAPNGLNILIDMIYCNEASIYLGDSFNTKTKLKSYFKWQSKDLELDFSFFVKKRIYRKTGKISNIILQREIAKVVKNKYYLNNIWPHMSILVYMLDMNEKAYLIHKPISLKYDNEDNLLYSAKGMLLTYVSSYIDIYNETKDNIKKENKILLKNTQYFIEDSASVFVFSSFLDKYKDILNLNLNLITKLDILNKVIFSFFFIIPNLIPFPIKRIMIKYFVYFTKGKKFTDNFLKKMNLLSEKLNNTDKDNPQRDVSSLVN